MYLISNDLIISNKLFFTNIFFKTGSKKPFLSFAKSDANDKYREKYSFIKYKIVNFVLILE